MTATRHETIVTAIVTALQTITTGNGYRTTVGAVEYVLKDWEEAKLTSALPLLGVAHLTSVPEYSSTSLIEMTMRLAIAAHLEAAPGLAKLTALANLEDDVIAALHEDVTLGGEAEGLWITQAATDEGDPYKASRPTGTALFDVLVKYERTTGKSP